MPLLFLPGLAIRFWAAGFIGPVSRSSKISSDRLATRGPYSLFRHPLYIGNALLVTAGLALLRPHWLLIALTAVAFVLLYILLSRGEEGKLLDRYGDEYAAYRRRVTPFFPRKYEGSMFAGFNVRWAMAEYQTWILVGVLFGLAFVRTLFPSLI
ncbi:isoprenylcysteine carboxylmethyltransferase family protein [candidate division WOR-3 bacterium]|nr:isoprenylcysteine carboxylmethyltransferase family protein [candidate division WOR-3 bacterium]